MKSDKQIIIDEINKRIEIIESHLGNMKKWKSHHGAISESQRSMDELLDFRDWIESHTSKCIDEQVKALALNNLPPIDKKDDA